MANNSSISLETWSPKSLAPQRSLTSSSPTPLLRTRSSTPNLRAPRVGYHKPTSEWFRTSTMSAASADPGLILSSEITSSLAKSLASIPKHSATPSDAIAEIDIGADRSTSPMSVDIHAETLPGLKSMASSPSLRTSPSSFSTSVITPPISPSCSDVGVCTNHDTLENKDEHILGRKLKLSDPYPPKLPTARTFIAPGVDLTFQELVDAQNLTLYNQEGQGIRFGDLFRDQKAIVIFIRHFLCPFCADYMRAIVRQVSPKALAKSNVKLLVVSHGSPHMIKSYRSIFNLPYPVYTDPSRNIYRALNMTLRTLSGGPKSDRGDYLEHNLTLGLARVAKNAIRAQMPLYRYPGDFFQVGGEFVLGPGLQCTYVSRMYNTASHAPISEVLKAAGVGVDAPVGNDVGWARTREEELERIRQKKGRRRGHPASSPLNHATQNDFDQMSAIETSESVDITYVRELLHATRQLSL